MQELTSTPGIVALAAGAVALLALATALVLALSLRRLRAAQRVVIGNGPPRDLVAFVDDLERRLDELARRTERATGELAARADEAERRLEGAITHAAVVRYDAYNEMSGRQSSSIALLDDRRSGVVLSSIHHREQARLYAKPIVEGRSEFALSPEEEQAVSAAVAGEEIRVRG